VDHENIAIRVVHYPCNDGAQHTIEPTMVATASNDDKIDVEGCGGVDDVSPRVSSDDHGSARYSRREYGAR
jgi:hypothetical protein